MAEHIFPLIIALVACGLCVMVLRSRSRGRHRPLAAAVRQRLLKPRTPDDCPACRQRRHATPGSLPPPPVRPWREVKSRRGACCLHDLRQRLAPGCLPVFTSDGLNLYFYALTAHFGQWVTAGGQRTRQWQVVPSLIYGQVKKTYRRRKVVRVTRVMRCGTIEDLRAALHPLGLSGRLNTAVVERVNLTIRQGVAALARRTWATAQAAPSLLAHLEWWRGYYHFVRPHVSLRVSLGQPIERRGRWFPQRYRQRTPAMAAGLTNRRWTVRELLLVPFPSAAASLA